MGPREIVAEGQKTINIAEKIETEIVGEFEATARGGGREGVSQVAETENDTAEDPIDRRTTAEEGTILEKCNTETQLQQVYRKLCRIPSYAEAEHRYRQ